MRHVQARTNCSSNAQALIADAVLDGSVSGAQLTAAHRTHKVPASQQANHEKRSGQQKDAGRSYSVSAKRSRTSSCTPPMAVCSFAASLLSRSDAAMMRLELRFIADCAREANQQHECQSASRNQLEAESAAG